MHLVEEKTQGVASRVGEKKKGKKETKDPPSRSSGQEYQHGDDTGEENNQDEILKGNYFVLGANNR